MSSIPTEEKPFTHFEEPAWKSQTNSWSFEEIGEEFDDHVRKHVPGYDQIQSMAVSAAMWHCYAGARVLDVGCSTGLTLSLLGSRAGAGFHGVGIDIVDSMLDRCRERASARRVELEKRGTTLNFIRQSIVDLRDEQGFDVILALFALQFVPTPDRWAALSNIGTMLRPGGVFILVEKTQGDCAEGADLFQGIYSDWKLQSGVPPHEILAKWSSLRGRLMPWRAEQYETWARCRGLKQQAIWGWGPFKAWAFWKPVDAPTFYPSEDPEPFV